MPIRPIQKEEPASGHGVASRMDGAVFRCALRRRLSERTGNRCKRSRRSRIRTSPRNMRMERVRSRCLCRRTGNRTMVPMDQSRNPPRRSLSSNWQRSQSQLSEARDRQEKAVYLAEAHYCRSSPYLRYVFCHDRLIVMLLLGPDEAVTGRGGNPLGGSVGRARLQATLRISSPIAIMSS